MRTQSPTSSRDQCIFFFSHARTRSNLFMKVLGDNPDVSKIVYPFFSAYKYGPEPIFQREAPIYTETPGHESHKETFQNAFDVLSAKIDWAKRSGKTPLIMNHTYFVLDPDVIATNLYELYGMEQQRKLRKPVVVDRSSTVSQEHMPNTPEAPVLTLHNRRNQFVADNGPPNPTLLPTSFLESINTPIFMIRHPVRFIPSFYRAARHAGYNVALDGPEFAISATLRWTRLLFEWFVAHNHDDDEPEPRDFGNTEPRQDVNMVATRHPVPSTRYPILIDSSDLIWDRNLLPRLCERLGLDSQHLKYSWDPTPAEARQANGQALAVFMRSLHESTGIETAQVEREQDLAMEEESGKLIEEFGERIGKGLWSYIEAAMVDWEYLKMFRFV